MHKWLIVFFFFISCAFANEKLSYSLVESHSHKKYKKRFFRILAIAKEIEDPEDLYYEVCRTIKYFNEIPGFRSRSFLEKQTTLLHKGAAALWALENRKRMTHKRVSNFKSPIYLLFENQKHFGVFKQRDNPKREVAAWDLGHLFHCSD